MNARTDKKVLSAVDPLDVTDVEVTKSTAVALVSPADRLEITEVLDALPKDADGNVIKGIVPIKYDLTDALLAEHKAAYTGVVFEVGTPEGKKLAKEAAGKLSKLKTSMDDAYKAWNTPIMAMTKHAREQKEKAQDAIAALLTPIQKQIDDQKVKDEAAEVARALAESRRVDAHSAALTALQTLPDGYVTASVADIEAVIREISSFDYLTKRNWEEYSIPAQDAQRTGIEKLKTHLENAKAREALAVMQAEQAAKEAERERTDALKERIRNIETAPMGAFGTTVAHMAKLIDRLDRTDVSEFGDMQPQAEQAVKTARAMIVSMQAQQKSVEDAAVVAQQNAAELQRLQDAQAEQERAEQVKRDAEATAEAQRKEAAAQAERDAQAEREREAEAERKRVAQAAAQAKARAQEVAETLRDLLIEARPFVSDADLGARMDAAIATAQGEAA